MYNLSDTEGKSAKLRRVSENGAIPVPSCYTLPPDLAKSVTELPNTRQNPTKALIKVISHALTAIQKQ